MWRAAAWGLLIAVLLAGGGCGAGTASPEREHEPATVPTRTPRPAVLQKLREPLPVRADGEEHTVALYTSHPLGQRDATITRAVIVIHGSARNADDYFDYAVEAVRGAPGVAVVAPWFASSADRTRGQLYWSDEGWKQGDESLNDDAEVSSFVVLDALIARLDQAFPQLQEIAVAGHSAGGQFVQRYAATSTDPRLNFVVANPSSYMYLRPERPSDDGFTVPATECDYDEYKYGLRDLNDHMDSLGREVLRLRYAEADVFYLLGSEDTDPDDSDLDDGCEALAQGRNRLERGLGFYAHLASVYGSAVYGDHRLSVVPGVGHDGRKMLTSRVARQILLTGDSQDLLEPGAALRLSREQE